MQFIKCTDRLPTENDVYFVIKQSEFYDNHPQPSTCNFYMGVWELQDKEEEDKEIVTYWLEDVNYNQFEIPEIPEENTPIQ